MQLATLWLLASGSWRLAKQIHLTFRKSQQPAASSQTPGTRLNGPQTLSIPFNHFPENHQFLHILGALT
jgi:hypothetical protein